VSEQHPLLLCRIIRFVELIAKRAARESSSVNMNPTLWPGLSDEAFSGPPKRQKTSYPDTENDLRYNSYTAAWICVLHIETAAALAMLDEIHSELPRRSNDNNTYTLGSIKNHNTVIGYLPQDQYGNCNTANGLTNLTRTFLSVNSLGLMVFIHKFL